MQVTMVAATVYTDKTIAKMVREGKKAVGLPLSEFSHWQIIVRNDSLVLELRYVNSIYLDCYTAWSKPL